MRAGISRVQWTHTERVKVRVEETTAFEDGSSFEGLAFAAPCEGSACGKNDHEVIRLCSEFSGRHLLEGSLHGRWEIASRTQHMVGTMAADVIRCKMNTIEDLGPVKLDSGRHNCQDLPCRPVPVDSVPAHLLCCVARAVGSRNNGNGQSGADER